MVAEGGHCMRAGLGLAAGLCLARRPRIGLSDTNPDFSQRSGGFGASTCAQCHLVLNRPNIFNDLRFSLIVEQVPRPAQYWAFFIRKTLLFRAGRGPAPRIWLNPFAPGSDHQN